MQFRTGVLLGIVCLMSTAAGSLQAGILPTHPNAYVDNTTFIWRGTANYSVTVFTHKMIANVEYAVFAPGTLPAGIGADPSGGDHFVYVYQLFNDLGTGANKGILNLTVGFDSDAPYNPGQPSNLGSINVAGGQDTTSARYIPVSGSPKTSVLWDWSPGSLMPGPGKWSDYLIFTSPFRPEFTNGAMQGQNSLVQSKPLPSPIPEPGAFTLGCLGAAALALVHAAKRRKSLIHN